MEEIHHNISQYEISNLQSDANPLVETKQVMHALHPTSHLPLSLIYISMKEGTSYLL